MTYSQDLVANFSSSAEVCHAEICRNARREQAARCHGQRTTEVDLWVLQHAVPGSHFSGLDRHTHACNSATMEDTQSVLWMVSCRS